MDVGRRKLWAASIAALALAGSVAVALATGPSRAGASYADARAVVDRHCVGCHAEQTTVPAFPIAAGGVKLDTAAEMQLHAPRILLRVVVQRNMPLLNKTDMTDEERELLRGWVEAGADGP